MHQCSVGFSEWPNFWCKISGRSWSTGDSRPKTRDSFEPSEEAWGICFGGTPEKAFTFWLVGPNTPIILYRSLFFNQRKNSKKFEWLWLLTWWTWQFISLAASVGPTAQSSLLNSASTMQIAVQLGLEDRPMAWEVTLSTPDGRRTSGFLLSCLLLHLTDKKISPMHCPSC